MKTALLVLGAATLLAGLEGARAAPSAYSQAYVAAVAAQADARLANAGVAIPGGRVKVQGTLSGDRLQNARLVASTGDLDADRAIEQSLRRLKVAPVPAELSGRDVVLSVSALPAAPVR
ncbi:hypothetical protein [Phenylobacterium sp. J367]|uniref:hypothetical protein n=1 Tax=Phenylobacterium sp. J367 TaxID=2898435 RepID=UPI0021516313|nr:hypothetical protein [Phenylobacterium sp. J367]MCR5877849.1 hypothetical protein [Phenylobacterium sp. J367]